MIAEEPRVDAAKVTELAKDLETELARLIVGQQALVRDTVIALIAGGHVLLEGVPGLGKTVLVRSLGQALSTCFSRMQFTPDLMPADIVGTNVIGDEAGRREFHYQAGPIFANLVLADEINRATPKTQSALLEAMQEHTVTVGTQTRPLPSPFFVLATQNPIELEGTYPLPEAQLDRFFLQTLVLAAKVRALLEGRYNVAFDDLSAVAQPALRHRIFLQFEAEADGISADRLITDILEHTVKESARA